MTGGMTGRKKREREKERKREREKGQRDTDEGTVRWRDSRWMKGGMMDREIERERTERHR